MAKVIVAGATGLVGTTIIKILEERDFPIDEIKFLASQDSVGKKLSFLNQEISVKELKAEEFEGFDIAFFALDSDLSREFVPEAIKRKVKVVDNSSYFRMMDEIPLVVPEVNMDKVKEDDYLISSPNCSTIQCMAPLYQLDKKYGLKRVVYSSYQSVSGSGKKALDDLKNGTSEVYPYPIKGNVLVHIDDFLESGYTKEEMKMIEETRKILNKPDLAVTATTVRVPVEYGHCVSINIELENDFSIEDVRDLFDGKLGVELMDDPEKLLYPYPKFVEGKDPIYVGRIRRDESLKYGLNIWVAADNIRKGAALNVVQIGEKLL